MVLETDPGPGGSAYISSLWSVTANGQATYCYGYERVTRAAVTGFWAQGESLEIGWARVGTDGPVTFEVTSLGDPITSVRVFPQALYTAEIVGGKVIVTLPLRGRCAIVINGVRKNRLWLCADIIYPQPDVLSPTVDVYNGTQVSAVANRTLYFDRGVHDLVGAGAWGGILFPIEADATVYLARGAVVIGNFDLNTGPSSIADSVLISGPGNISGEFTTSEDVELLPNYDAMIENAIIRGRIPTGGVGGINNTVRGITIFASPFHAMTAEGVNEVRDVGVFSPWSHRCDGVKAWAAGGTAIIEHNVCWSGDDAIGPIESWWQETEISNNTLSTSGAQILNFGYQQGYPDLGFTTTVTNTYVFACHEYYYVALNDTEGGSVMMIWNDATSLHPEYGRFHITVDGLWIEGDEINSIPFHFGTRIYNFPDGIPGEGYGSVSDVTVRNVFIEVAPGTRSKIWGLDSTNTPNNVSFEGMVIGDEIVSVRNYAEFFNINDYPFNIRFGGRLVVSAVDVCNLALGFIGNKAKVTAIEPPDGSAEATMCARLYPQALRSVLEMHNWSFAKRKVELTVVNADPDDTDDPAWQYRYQLPQDWVKIISILPDGTTNDYLVAGTKQPVDHEIKFSETDEQQRLYTNEADAWMRYIYYEDDPNQWSHLFIQALAWHLAAMLAGPLIKGDQGHAEAQRCLQRMGAYLAEARVKDSNERQATVERKASWIRGR